MARIESAKRVGAVYLWRDAKGYAHANVPHRIVRHSPTGFEWGYGGSGPADLALNILAHLFGREIAFEHYQDFKRDFICTVDHHGGVITVESIRAWLRERGVET